MKLKYPQIIVEIANSHDGNKKKLFEMIDQISSFSYPNVSIKLQIFSPKTIALEDYEWYEVYEKITFNSDFWDKCIRISHEKVGKVWIDVFDSFSVDIVRNNIEFITGLKLQASVLENYEVRGGLTNLDLKDIRLMINISGYDLNHVDKLLVDFEKMHPKEIILQVGFQSYPTNIEDTGLQKIDVIKNYFKYRVCLADHLDASSEAAVEVPVYGLAIGSDLIEKHICLDREKTKYDYYSSLCYEEFELMFKKIESFLKSKSGLFISKSENEYLRKSVQIPILNQDLRSEDLISIKDLKFRRSNQNGLTYSDIVDMQNKFMLLKAGINKNLSIKSSDFKKASIGVVIAGRLKSSRLKRKAILPIMGKPSIQWCFESCLDIPNVEKVILATSTLDEDSDLENYLIEDERLFFYRGEPDDVIKRYIGACDEYGIDVVIRVTADCPFVSRDIALILLEEHFKSGADYTAPKSFAVGTNCEIINVSALKRVIGYLGKAELSEYMTWYFQNNPDIFKVNIVSLPDHLIRDYRLTLDYQEDLDMFEELLSELDGNNPSTENIFKILDSNPNISNINSHILLKYKTDKELIDTLNRRTRIHL
jgi:N,N'-diacetyllegionaminate synthase